MDLNVDSLKETSNNDNKNFFDDHIDETASHYSEYEFNEFIHEKDKNNLNVPF